MITPRLPKTSMFSDLVQRLARSSLRSYRRQAAPRENVIYQACGTTALDCSFSIFPLFRKRNRRNDLVAILSPIVISQKGIALVYTQFGGRKAFAAKSGFAQSQLEVGARSGTVELPICRGVPFAVRTSILGNVWWVGIPEGIPAGRGSNDQEKTPLT